LANGFCDNLLTATVRALGNKPLIIAPAMNPAMWENRITQNHIDQLTKYYEVDIIQPISKVLIDGDKGKGGLAEEKGQEQRPGSRLRVVLSKLPVGQD